MQLGLSPKTNETMSQSKPMQGRELVRDQLELEHNARFEGYYNPVLVFLDGEWHHPITAEETYCGKSIPDPVIAVENNSWSGPSSMGCSECQPRCGGITKRSLKRQISKYLEHDMNRSGTFPKEALAEILEIIERGHIEEGEQ